MTRYALSQDFEHVLKKLDRHERELLLKRMQKILEHPELGKPLRAPLQTHRSERLEAFRIVYEYRPNESFVFFAWIDHRKDAYR